MVKRALIACGMVLVAGCEGVSGLAGKTSESPVTGSAVGESPLRRLTRAEYNATVTDLLQLSAPSAAADAFPADPSALGFDNIASAQTLPQALVEAYANAAEQLSEQVDVAVLAPCATTASPSESCAPDFIRGFGRRAFRRPLTDAEAARALALFSGESAARGAVSGIRLLTMYFLQSPHFLFRPELGVPDASGPLQRLSGYEIASRLSYFLWGSMPDEALFAAAANGGLATRDGVLEEARRLLASPRARSRIARFHAQWMMLERLDATEKDESLFPDWPKLKPQLRKELELFADDVFWNRKDARQLLTSNASFLNADLAKLYGVSGAPEGALAPSTLDPAQRAGFLTSGGFLAMTGHTTQSSPTQRGKFVRERLLCTDLPPPAPGVATNLPSPSPTATTRDRYLTHASNVACRGCHLLMDPIGFGLENFDAVGAWRTQEGTRPVDASGELVEADDASGIFQGPVELAQRLGSSRVAMDCFSRQWFRFALGRLESVEEAASLKQVESAFSEHGFDPSALVLALVQSDPFLFRATQP